MKPRKPGKLLPDRDITNFAECLVVDDKTRQRGSVVHMTLFNAAEARRLADWLVKAAEWIEGREK